MLSPYPDTVLLLLLRVCQSHYFAVEWPERLPVVTVAVAARTRGVRVMSRINQALLSISIVFLTFLLTLFLIQPWNDNTNSVRLGRKSQAPIQSASFHAPLANPWNELTSSDVDLISHHLNVHNGVNLTQYSIISRASNEKWIYQLELLRPNKSDVVHYLDKNDVAPKRWARATLLEFTVSEARLVDYMVGPLDSPQDLVVMPLVYPYNSGRNFVSTFANTDLNAVLIPFILNVTDISRELLGADVYSPSPNGLRIGARMIFGHPSRLTLWMQAYRDGDKSDAMSMLPQGLFVKVTASISPSGNETMDIGEWYYNGHEYANTAALRQAMSRPNFTKAAMNLDGSWTDTDDFKTNRNNRDKPPPLSIQPYELRYDIDEKEKYISWMGFSFYIATSPGTAVALFDVRFNDTRLIYHIGLQEALAHYAGSDPAHAGLEWLDAFFGMGENIYPLVPGYDCPAYADYLDIPIPGPRFRMIKNAICVFEFTSDAPLQRHTNSFGVSVSRNTYLVVRSVSTLGNYDYTIDYIFYLDGSIEVKVRASGFIATAFDGYTDPSPEEESNEYGYRIHDATRTSIHDHVLLFRADVDIGGTENTFVRTSIEPITKQYPWDKPEFSEPRNTMHLTHHPVTHEMGLNWPQNGQQIYLIESNQTNKWGSKRAYRIQPGTGMGTPSHLTILNSTALNKSASWSSSDLWILKNHLDTEPVGAHPFNYLCPDNPLVDFAKMVDIDQEVGTDSPESPTHERITEEDLVLYFNLGGHHIPTTQDIPNTLMHTSASSIMFTPFNYFDHDVSIHTRQGVNVDVRRGWTSKTTDKAETHEHDHLSYKRASVLDNGVDSVGDEIRYFGGRYNVGKEGLKLSQKDLEPDLTPLLKMRCLNENLMGSETTTEIGKTNAQHCKTVDNEDASGLGRAPWLGDYPGGFLHV